MSGTQTRGFDVVYEISLSRFLRVLETLFIEDLPLRLHSVDFSFTVRDITQTGSVTLPSRPTASLARDTVNPNRFTLTLQFLRSDLLLNAVPGGGLPGAAGLPGLPITPFGTPTLVLPLEIDTATSGGRSPVTLSVPASPTATLNGFSLSSTVLLPVLSGATREQMLAAVRNAATAAVIDAVHSLFPLVRDVTLPTTGPCNLFVRNMRMKLLAGDAAHGDSLSFMLNLQSGSTGDFAGTSVSRLPTGSEGALLISNSLLLELICCLLPRSSSLADLSRATPTRTTSPACCRWSNITNFRLGTETVDLTRFDVCVGTNAITVGGALRRAGTGWWVTASFDFSVTLRNNAGNVEPVVGAPVLVTDSGVEWWVWLLAALAVIVGAVIGFLIGGPLGSALVGALIGGLIGALISGIVVAVLYAVGFATTAAIRAALGTLAGTLETLQLLPADLTDTFGVLTLVGDPVIDDLTLRGRVVLPESRPAQAESPDQLIAVGETFNLDRGTVVPRYASTGLTDPDADLFWGSTGGGGRHPGGIHTGGLAATTFDSGRSGRSVSGGLLDLFTRFPSISARGSARLVALPGHSFWALTETDLAGLLYPDTVTSIAGLFVPTSDEPEPADTVVFAVRTTEGRYAKCEAWQDSAGRLHLRYRTYATRLPLYLVSWWTSTRGTQVDTGVDFGGGFYTEYAVSRRGTFRAEPQTLRSPVSYAWLWDGRPISGAGTLPDGMTHFNISGHVCTIETRMGRPLSGELCVTATDAAGFKVTSCREVNVAGTERVRTGHNFGHFEQFLLEDRLAFRIPLPDPPDLLRDVATGFDPAGGAQLTLEKQITRALAAGMEVSESKINLR